MANSFDDLKKSISGLLQRSVKSVDQLAETIDARADMARMAARIRSLKHQREEVIAQIGRKVYTLHTKGKVHNTDILADCKEVDALGKQIEALQAQIEELRKGPADKPPVVPLKDETPLPAEEPEPAPPTGPVSEPPAEPAEADAPDTTGAGESGSAEGPQ